MIPPLNTDWLEFVESFNANGVEYLVVGAFAVAHHGRPRLTVDLDQVIQLGFPPLRIDLITSISGVPSFEERGRSDHPGRSAQPD